MPNYRRLFIPGGTWFFTVNLADRRSALLIERLDDLKRFITTTKRRRPFRIEAMVILPDHLHTIWSLPEGDSDFSGRWRAIKKDFSKLFPATEARSESQVRRGERSIWQARFWEHLIRDDADCARHVDYCYWNPVKHGYAKEIGEWPYSTCRRDVRCGRHAAAANPYLIEHDDSAEEKASFGERGG